MNPRLFIGGSLDGQWIHATDRCVFNPVIREPARVLGNDSTIAQNLMVDRDEYMLRVFPFLSGVCVLYALSRMNEREIFEQLMQHYRPTT